MDWNKAVRGIFEGSRPITRGMFYSKEERGPVSWYFVAFLMAVLGYGLIMLFSASYSTGYYRQNGDSFYYIRQQFELALVGVGLMAVLSNVNYRWIRRFTWTFYLLSIALLIWALTLPGDENGFKRWVYIFGTSFQPSEVAKFAVILTTAMLVDLHKEKRHTLKYGIVVPVLPLLLIVVLMILEPHWSGTILMLMIFFTMLVCAGCAMRWMGLVLGGGGALLIFLLNSQDNYVKTRLEGWTLISGNTAKLTYQTRQSLYSIASGGWFGLGIANSRQKHLWLPEATNDFIFAVLCEELGFLGAAVCLLLFAVLILSGIQIALRAPDLYGTVLGIGIMAQVAWQVFCNVAVVTNTIPNTGISLPFFSSGGTSLLMLLGEMGVMLSLSRAGNAQTQRLQQQQQAEFDRRLGRQRVYHRGESV